MERDELVTYCLAKPGAEETYPWGEAELVAKVGGRAFAFIGLGGGTVGLKCGRDAEEAAEWRDRYPGAITMSAYVGRYGWNSVDWTGKVPDDELRELIDASYEAIVAALPKSKRPVGRPPAEGRAVSRPRRGAGPAAACPGWPPP